MTATEPKKMTERERFALFIQADEKAAALLATAEKTIDGVAYGVLADHLEECNETAWAVVFRTCIRSEEYGLKLDGSTYHTFPGHGYNGKTVYNVTRLSPKLRSKLGHSEYVYSARDLISYMTVRRQLADAKAARAAKRQSARDEAKTQPNPYAVGDVLHWSGGYNMTYNVFMQVVAVGRRTVTVRNIETKVVEQQGWSERVKGAVGQFTSEPKKVTIRPDINGDKVTGWSVPVGGRHFTKVDPNSTHYENTND